MSIHLINKKFMSTLASPQDRIVVGLSGGADSVALLHSLKSQGYENLLAVHINHNLRSQAQADQAFAVEIAGAFGVPITIYQADVKGYAKTHRLGIEDAGRKLRYRYLSQPPHDKIATGHHQNDTAETILMHLARGAGLDGLTGIPQTNGKIIRPLIHTSRQAIEDYLHHHNIPYITDHTNLQNHYTRNRIRNIILPQLQEATNPQAIANIAASAQLLAQDRQYLDQLAEKAYMTSCAGDSNYHIDKLIALPAPILSRVVRKIIGTHNITQKHIQAVINLIHGKTGKEINLPGLTLRKEYQHLVCPSTAPAESIRQTDTNSYFVPSQRLNITIAEKNITKSTKNRQILCAKAFKCDNIKDITIRYRKPGDKIRFANFSKKLQDYFTDNKTPQYLRDKIPVVAIGSDILWILDEKSPTAHMPEVSKIQNPVWVILWRDLDEYRNE